MPSTLTRNPPVVDGQVVVLLRRPFRLVRSASRWGRRRERLALGPQVANRHRSARSRAHRPSLTPWIVVVEACRCSASAAEQGWSAGRRGTGRGARRGGGAIRHRRDAIVAMVDDVGRWCRGRRRGRPRDRHGHLLHDRARRLDTLHALHQPLGPVVVRRRGTSRFAIPAGGVLAALAAGNAVILKPAPETVATASLLRRPLWDAGIRRDVVQFVPCPDDEVGRRLVTHPERVGGDPHRRDDTARLFLSWRPDLRLHAETSGKNAIVVTAAADVDLAVARPRPVRVRPRRPEVLGRQPGDRRAVRARRRRAFLAKLADATRTLRVGPAADLAADVGPLIRPPEGRSTERSPRSTPARDGWCPRGARRRRPPLVAGHQGRGATRLAPSISPSASVRCSA